jgi:hypothetical protein
MMAVGCAGSVHVTILFLSGETFVVFDEEDIDTHCGFFYQN